VTTYGANGAPTPPTIGGTGYPALCGVAVDAAGKIFVASGGCDFFGAPGNNTVTTYTAAGAQTTPTITGLSDPEGVVVDPAGKLYVANAGNNTVTTYFANGTRATPTITGLSDPLGIAVH
jgi:serine/threonine-protein kinase